MLVTWRSGLQRTSSSGLVLTDGADGEMISGIVGELCRQDTKSIWLAAIFLSVSGKAPGRLYIRREPLPSASEMGKKGRKRFFDMDNDRFYS